VSYVPGLGEQAASFNGKDSYVAIPNPVTKDFSIAMWLRTTDTGADGPWSKGRGLVSGSAGGFGTTLTAGKLAFGVGAAASTSTAAINDGVWHHVVATRNATSGALQIYVDGTLNTSGTGPTGRSGGTDLRIGSIKDGGSAACFNGAIDQVQIFDYVLSATDVAVLCNRTKASLP
jgi:MSHA biogenesis protein MshQ